MPFLSLAGEGEGAVYPPVYGKPNGSEFAWFSPPCDY